MELTKYKIGELIELTNEKNANGLYGEDDAIGVNIDKIIMPMRGNLEKKDFSNFHLVPPRHFAYNPRGSRKLGIGFNDTEKTFIITFIVGYNIKSKTNNNNWQYQFNNQSKNFKI